MRMVYATAAVRMDAPCQPGISMAREMFVMDTCEVMMPVSLGALKMVWQQCDEVLRYLLSGFY